MAELDNSCSGDRDSHLIPNCIRENCRGIEKILRI